MALGVINITDEQGLSSGWAGVERHKGAELRTTARLAVWSTQSQHLSQHEAIADGSQFLPNTRGGTPPPLPFSAVLWRNTHLCHAHGGWDSQLQQKRCEYHNVWDKSNNLWVRVGHDQTLPLAHAAIGAWWEQGGQRQLCPHFPWIPCFWSPNSPERPGMGLGSRRAGLGTAGVKGGPRSSCCYIFNTASLHLLNTYFIYGYPKV